ncbi:hypothetical protein CVT26_014097 [Gymnopilus dilepis]|uniref:Zinc finger PHD-type domain-containing protein n=1 Tax=Gymnopilus dilepis TaxID=231916 RepID=A0A409Y8K4_9AGAR|nr:hypothetical protein CVT26_014097 [Gymnopilus dilepis]
MPKAGSTGHQGGRRVGSLPRNLSLLDDPRRECINNEVSFFRGARDFNVYGGNFYNISGDNTVLPQGHAQSERRDEIIQGLPVVSHDDISLEREVLKGCDFRLYAGHNAGRVVAIKIYEGSRAKERCSRAAKFYAGKFHPNIPYMVGISSAMSPSPFLLFKGGYDGPAEYMLRESLKKGLRQTLIAGLQTIAGLSAGLDYLNDHGFPFGSVNLDDFVLLSNRDKVVLSIEPANPFKNRSNLSGDFLSDRTNEATSIFRILCEKAFDGACSAHYESEQFRCLFEESEESSEDSEEINPEASNPIYPEITGAKFPSSGLPSLNKEGAQCRWELLWRSHQQRAITLSEISSQFQYALISAISSSDLGLRRCKSRTPTRTSHQCPGYNRVVITLTPDASGNAVVLHTTPVPFEICHICNEVVRSNEAFNCICGERDNGSTPTVKCGRCSEWHHRHCVDAEGFSVVYFICATCQDPSSTSTSDVDAPMEY